MRTLLVIMAMCCLEAAWSDDEGTEVAQRCTELTQGEPAGRDSAEIALRAAIRAGHSDAVARTVTAALTDDRVDADARRRGDRVLSGCAGGAIVADLRARLILKPLDASGAGQLTAPFGTLPAIEVQLTNLADDAVQVPHSSYPWYRFFKLEIVPVGGEGAEARPLAIYPDLYPTKDMKRPTRQHFTLGPGDSEGRDMGTLLAEGYLLRTLLMGRVDAVDDYLSRGFGALRLPGRYRITGVYAIEPTDFEGKPDAPDVDGGRDETIRHWGGPVVRTNAVEIVVVKASR